MSFNKLAERGGEHEGDISLISVGLPLGLRFPGTEDSVKRKANVF